MTTQSDDTSQQPVVRRGRGRPKGVRNKPKVAPPELPAIVPIGVRERDACRILGISVTTAKALVQAGEVEVYYDGRRKRFLYASLVAYAERKLAETQAAVAEAATTGERKLHPNLKPRPAAPSRSDMW